MLEGLVIVAIVLLAIVVALLLVLLLRDRRASVGATLRQLENGRDRSDRLLREEMERSRDETARSSRQVREEMAGVVKDWETPPSTASACWGHSRRASSTALESSS